MSQVVTSPDPEPGLCDEPTRFQLLAAECALTEDELRGLLLRLIAKKVGWSTPRKALTCISCGHDFEVSSHGARVITNSGERPRCWLCRQDLTPGPSEIKWLTELPPDVLTDAVEAMAAIAA